MVSSSLRRSQRGKSTSFKQGDNVEIVKNKGLMTGLLIRKLDESKPSNPVWIVRFDNGMKDQAIPEKSLGRVVPTSTTRPRGRPHSNQSDNSSSVTNSSDCDDKAVRGSISATTLTSSQEGKQIPKKKGLKNKQQQVSDMSHSKIENNAANTEEQQGQQAGINTRSSAKGKRNNASLDSIPTPKQPTKKAKKDMKEEVVKVQYSTGTLYLHRGANPKAVFKWNY